MTNDNAAPPESSEPLMRLILETLRRHGGEALTSGAGSMEAAARAWLDAGFADPEEVDDWLAARCFDPRCARTLDDSGVTPEQAALRTRAGRADYEETVAYKFAHGDITLEETRRIITSDFWNS